MFTKILIANRGEIACRVARTAKALGIQTVAVYSEADATAPHTLLCDEAVFIGPSPATESYLRVEAIIDAAKRTGAQAIHPGYGFLSENADFADALDAQGITFIGPTAATIRAMGSKAAAKDLMENAGVPTTPGYQGADQSVETFRREAARIGYPVLLKATAGGGGKGMRRVDRDEDLAEALASAQREAKSSFGDDRFLIEKFVAQARHVEVQIFGDGEGGVVHCFERDCSLQRRHQKVIEEAPAPNLPATVREHLLTAGVNAGRAVKYRGAGTVEFLYDEQAQSVYFMEMNTRLQVEHPVSEAITGLDFVEWQLRIAAGEGLPLDQEAITETGHAFEARLYAENPLQDFAPSIGTLTTLDLPTNAARCDSGVRSGQAITPFYDPMIAKIITSGADRSSALGSLLTALGTTTVASVETNAEFLHALAAHDAFKAANVSTRFIDEHADALFSKPDLSSSTIAAAILSQRASRAPLHQGFRLNQPHSEIFWIEHDGATALCTLQSIDDDFELHIDASASAAARKSGDASPPADVLKFSGFITDDDAIRVTVDDITQVFRAAPHNGRTRVWHGAQHADITFVDPQLGPEQAASSEGSLTAPMPGVITHLGVEVGAEVEAGTTLVVMEAMKMEHSIKAPSAGRLVAFHFSVGEQVRDGDLLLDFEEA